MTEKKLNNIDHQDIEDVIKKVETTFGIQFHDGELSQISNLGQFCDYITDKIQLEQSNDCTSQQAFYKLREAISRLLDIDKNTIAISSTLENIFPRQNRRIQIKKLEKYLGVKLKILRAPNWVSITLFIVLLISFVSILFKSLNGLFIFILSLSLLYLAEKLGNELDLETLGQLAEKMTREHYSKFRRKSNTINKKEVETVIINLFHHELFIEKEHLTRDASFV